MRIIKYLSVSSNIGPEISCGIVDKLGWCVMGTMRTWPPPGTSDGGEEDGIDD
jgi:hypothetical protein